MADRPPTFDPNRREYLRAAGLLGAAGMTGLAGCSGGSDGEGTAADGGDDGEGTADGDGGTDDGEPTGGDGDSGGSGQALEVLHSWTGGDGKDAVDALTRQFEAEHSDVQTDVRPVGGNTDLDTVVSKRLGDDDPPSSFSGRPGQNLAQYEGTLGDAGDVWEAFRDEHVEEAVEACTYDGTLVAVPVGSHRLNDLFFNERVVEEAGVTPRDIGDFQGLVDALDEVKTETDAVPMAHAMKRPWPTLQLFAVNMLSTQGYRPYVDFVEGNADKKAVIATLENTKHVLQNYVSDDASSLDSTSANQLLMSGEAAFVHQGNWVAGAYERRDGFEYDRDWGAVTYPGTEGMYTLHVDAFVYLGDNPTPEKTEQWLSFVGTKEAQTTFGTHKGSIPTRTDIDTDAESFGPYLASTVEDFARAEHKPPTLAHGLAVSPRVLADLASVVDDEFTGPYDVKATAEGMIRAVEDAGS